MRNNYSTNTSTYTKPGPLPIIPLPFHFRQDHRLKVRQELLHHKVAQDLDGQKIKMTCSHSILHMKTDITEWCANTSHLKYPTAELSQGARTGFKISGMAKGSSMHLNQKHFSWQTTEELTTDEPRCWTKMPVKIYCMLSGDCHVQINGAKTIGISWATKYLKRWFADCCFPKLTLFWDTHAVPEEVSSRRNCSRELSDRGCFW